VRVSRSEDGVVEVERGLGKEATMNRAPTARVGNTSGDLHGYFLPMKRTRRVKARPCPPEKVP
jgi:hypothetical protein